MKLRTLVPVAAAAMLIGAPVFAATPKAHDAKVVKTVKTHKAKTKK